MRNYQKDPPEFATDIYVAPDDLKNVYFRIAGLPEPSPYAGGEYIVHVKLSNDYPMLPPDVLMLTPTGRFSVGRKICTTFTSYHKESWTPMYDFRAILKSFLSFMLDDSEKTHIGYEHGSDADRRKFAAASAAWNKQKGYSDWFIAGKKE